MVVEADSGPMSVGLQAFLTTNQAGVDFHFVHRDAAAGGLGFCGVPWPSDPAPGCSRCSTPRQPPRPKAAQPQWSEQEAGQHSNSQRMSKAHTNSAVEGQASVLYTNHGTDSPSPERAGAPLGPLLSAV